MQSSVFLLLAALGSGCAWSQNPAAPKPQEVTAAAAPAPTPAPAAAEAPDTNVSVEKIVFAVDVSSRVPVGAADAFDASTPEVYCWNQLAIAKPQAAVEPPGTSA